MKVRHVVMNLGARFTEPVEKEHYGVEFIVQPYEVVPCTYIVHHIGVVVDDDGNMEPAMLTVRMFQSKDKKQDSYRYTLYAYGEIIELKTYESINDYVDADVQRSDYVTMLLPGVDGKTYRLLSNFCCENAPVHWVEYYQSENFRVVGMNSGLDEQVSTVIHRTGRVAKMSEETIDRLYRSMSDKWYKRTLVAKMHWDGWFMPVVNSDRVEEIFEETMNEIIGESDESKPMLH